VGLAARYARGVATAEPRVTERFDRRIVPDAVLEFLRACARREPFHLGGGAALAGVFLSHRKSRDVDLFSHEGDAHRDLVRALPAAAMEAGGRFVMVRDAGGHARGKLTIGEIEIEVDAVHEALPDLEPPPASIEGITVESLADLRAAKLTCLLSRREPRDLVDVLFLERAGFRPEADLELALRKDAGIDPAILIAEFPSEPMPEMLKPLTRSEFEQYRDDLALRLREIAIKV
jgi:hypothetical protein